MWPALEAMTPTLIYDAHVMGDSTLPAELLSRIALPVLVLRSAASRLAAGRRGRDRPHSPQRPAGDPRRSFREIPPETLAPVLAAFLRG